MLTRLVLFQGDIDGFRVSQMIQDKTLSAENSRSLFKDSEASAPAHAPDLRPVGHAVLNYLASSLWARRTLRPTAFRLAESVNIILKEY